MKKNQINIRFGNVLTLLKEKDPNNTQVNIMEKLNLDFINDEMNNLCSNEPPVR